VAGISWKSVAHGCYLSWIFNGSKRLKCNQAKPKKVPKGEKLRKQAIRKREAKLEKYNRPIGQRRVREPKEKRKEREEKLERFSRPKGQKLKKKNNK
jgi:hypothetical protein